MNRWMLTAALLITPAAFAGEAQDIWADKCQKCHGVDGRADTKMGKKEKIADLTTPEWQSKHTDTQIRKVIEDGSDENRKMKPYKDRLTPEQIDLLVVLIRDMKASN